MKKYLLVMIVLATSCCSHKEVAHRTDTLYVAQRHYDSVMIDRNTSTIKNHDTVVVNRMQTEYRYSFRTDTLHHHHTDTVVKTIVERVPAERCETHLWPMVGLTALVVGALVGRRWKT